MTTFVVLAILIAAVVADGTRDKRILLHSDIDIVQAIQALKADNAQLHSKIAGLQRQNVLLQSKLDDMESKSTANDTLLQNNIAQLQKQNAHLRGYMGGGNHEHTGAAANYLCLTAHPTWDHYDESMNAYGKVYGVEYQFYNHRADLAAKFFDTNIFHQNAPCAVCHASRSATMMIPGTKLCSPGWTKEYNGYLVSSYIGAKAFL